MSHVRSRDRILLPLIVMMALFLFGGSGCRRQLSGPHFTIAWDKAKPEVVVDQSVMYSGIEVGKVLEILPSAGGTSVKVGLHKQYAHYITEKTTFLAKAGDGANPAFIEAIALVKEAPPVQAGAVLAGSDSELEAKVRTWSTDWKKSILYGAIVLVAVLLLLLLGRLVLKMWTLVLCAVAGAAAAYYLAAPLEPYLRSVLPPGFRSDIFAYAAAFLLGCLGGVIVIGFIRSLLPSRQKGTSFPGIR